MSNEQKRLLSESLGILAVDHVSFIILMNFLAQSWTIIYKPWDLFNMEGSGKKFFGFFDECLKGFVWLKMRYGFSEEISMKLRMFLGSKLEAMNGIWTD